MNENITLLVNLAILLLLFVLALIGVFALKTLKSINRIFALDFKAGDKIPLPDLSGFIENAIKPVEQAAQQPIQLPNPNPFRKVEAIIEKPESEFEPELGFQPEAETTIQEQTPEIKEETSIEQPSSGIVPSYPEFIDAPNACQFCGKKGLQRKKMHVTQCPVRLYLSDMAARK